MGKLEDIKMIQRLGKVSQKDAQDYYANLNMNFRNAQEGIFKIRQIMKKYRLNFKAAYTCALDPAQLEMLKTMAS